MEQTINQRFKILRTFLGFDQTKMGQEIGLGQGAVSAIEKNRQTVTGATIEVLHSKYNVNKLWLIEGKGDMIIQKENTPTESKVTSYKDEALEALKSERDLLKSELQKAWALVQHFSKGAVNFPKPLGQAGRGFIYLPGMNLLRSGVGAIN
jgi:transcriptional regulator with XRE-family HTH domain